MKTLLQTILLLVLTFAAPLAQSQTGSSIVIHDNTSKANGGENATSNLRSELESALNKEKPCVDIMDDEDIRNVIESEREKNLLEGGDPQQVLTDIANLMGASYVMSVSAMPGVGGTTSYTVFVMNPQTGTTVARQTGTDAKQIAKSIVGQLGSSLPDNCKPHWVGEVKYVYLSNETKVTTDKGAAHAATRNTSRTKTETYSSQNTIVATLLPPKPGSAVSANKTIARVWMRSKILSEKKHITSGEVYCRPKGGNLYWTGYSLNYSEVFTQLGGGSDNLPVSVSIDNEGNYKIFVPTPSGTLVSKIETTRSESGCNKENPPTNDAQSMPEQKIDASGFDVTGKTDAKNRDTLSGSTTTPDGKTTITWKLRLVKPKKKN
ncbi:MAG: hypothetical protein IPO68_00915 [Chitinophagaceae bacterium]|nr:hypothetical protein [Chitinophagaceae bacterium]